MNYFLLHPSTITVIVHCVIVTGLVIRVIMRKPAIGVALAWILLISAAPFVGSAIYLLVGERRIGNRRFLGFQSLRLDYSEIGASAIKDGLIDVDWSRHPEFAKVMDRLGRSLRGFPTVRGSRYQLFSNEREILGQITNDIENSEHSVLMEFYIWNQGGLADEVMNAVIRAAKRGVYCCLLIDALGARPWWKSKQPQQLRDAGVHLQQALPVGLFRTFVGRQDLRMHRKIVVVDGKIAWTGSMNLVDPRFFKTDAGVGQWVDAMVRLEGSAVVTLAAVMIGDWVIETDQNLGEMIERAKLKVIEPVGNTDIQVIASGPGQSNDLQLQMILSLIRSARNEIVLTTPYLIPDDSLLMALRGVAAQGVKVLLIVPEKVDSFLARHASRSYFEELLECGIEVYLYRDGLIHTKSICVDQSISMFGTVNLDMRSLWLNYELALYVYDTNFAKDLRDLQQSYLDLSSRLDETEWSKRSYFTRLLENTFRLTAPLL